MNYPINSAADQIFKNGGQESARLLMRIFESDGSLFDEKFDVKRLFENLWDRYSGADFDKPKLRTAPVKPGWSGNGKVPGGFNVIPSLNPNGVCASLCLTLVPEGFRMGMRGGSYDIRNNSISFNKAILLQTALWFSCLKINQENIFLTPDWNQDVFEREYESVIESYCKHHGKKVFIVELGKTGAILRYPY